MDDYYVYVHICKDTDKIFYVGKGKKNRAYSSERNQRWQEYVKKHKYIVVILFKNKKEGEALVIERKLIKEHKDNGVLTNIIYNKIELPKITNIKITLNSNLREETIYNRFLKQAFEVYGNHYNYSLISPNIFYLYTDKFATKKYSSSVPSIERENYRNDPFLVTCNIHKIHFRITSVKGFLKGDWRYQCELCANEQTIKYNIAPPTHKWKNFYLKQIKIDNQIINYQFYIGRDHWGLNRLGKANNFLFQI
jgi:hypothetical protein